MNFHIRLYWKDVQDMEALFLPSFVPLYIESLSQGNRLKLYKYENILQGLHLFLNFLSGSVI